MPSPEFQRRLTAVDAAFLYAERRTAPMQIGAVSVLDSELTLDELHRHIATRIPKIDRFRQRVVMAPYNLGHPTWEFDPSFDISNHLYEYQLDAPGDFETLKRAVGPIYSRTMCRKKPLWEYHLFHGYEGNKAALVSAVHHAMVDGVGGNDLMAAMFDLEPIQPPENVPDPAPPATAEPLKPPATRFVDALWDTASTAVDAWAQYTNDALRDLSEWNHPDTRRARRALLRIIPRFLRPLRRMPFNRSCSGQRQFAWSEFSFAEARAIRGRLDVTVNDVVLTALSGALTRYARLYGEPTRNRTVRLMVPVSMRGEDGIGALGNQVSSLPVELPLGIDDPLERVQAIHEHMRQLKDSGIAREFHRLANALGGLVPAATQALVASQVNPSTPMFNMVCTNVPGPQIPLHIAGRRILSYLSCVPVGQQNGLCCQVFTYNQRLSIGFTADLKACSDVDRLKEFVDESFAELRIAAGVDEIDFIEFIPRRRWSTSPPAEAEIKPMRQPLPAAMRTSESSDTATTATSDDSSSSAEPPSQSVR